MNNNILPQQDKSSIKQSRLNTHPKVPAWPKQQYIVSLDKLSTGKLITSHRSVGFEQ